MKKFIIIILMITLLLPVKIFAEEPTSDTVTLSNCVDGNSSRFMLGLKEIKVKFLGIEAVSINNDSEEDKEDEEESDFVSNYVCESLKNAKTIKLEYDPGIEKEDKYGRIQAWVFVDDELLQEDLVEKGYAKIMYLNEDFMYIDKLKNAEKYAKENKLGVWKEEEKEPTEPKEEEEKEEKSKGFFQTILDFFAGLFQKLLDFIDDLINNIF